MPKLKSLFSCRHCGAQFPKWLGQCSDCGSWNSLEEETSVLSAASAVVGLVAPCIGEVDRLESRRMSSGDPALDRVLGGGLVPGSVVLLGGEPGIGKSTLLTEASGKIATGGGRALFLSGEESVRQIRLRADRLGVVSEGFLLASTNSLSEALAYIEGSKPDFVVVDSIQTLASEQLEGAAGSVSQVRHCAAALHAAAKSSDAALVIVGHVTKDGSIAGPRVLEHLVDAVLYFEGEGHGRLRALRAVKNRFGNTNEIALYEMGEDGLIEVENPSGALLAERQPDAPGTAVFPAVEGSRALLVEVQALVTPNYTNSPRRTIAGLDYNRASLVLAVMEKRCGFRLGAHDVFVNVVGGLQVKEPAADLALFLAVASSFKDTALPEDLVAFGEIGLTGEIRSVGGAEMRLREAARLGFKRAATSKNSKSLLRVDGIKAGGLRTVQDALALLSS